MTTSSDIAQSPQSGRSPTGVWVRRWIAAALLVAAGFAAFGRPNPVLLLGLVVFWPWVWERRNGRPLVVSGAKARARSWLATILLAAAALVLAACALHLFGEASSRWLVRGPAALALAALAAWVLRRT